MAPDRVVMKGALPSHPTEALAGTQDVIDGARKVSPWVPAIISGPLLGTKPPEFTYWYQLDLGGD